MIEDGPWKQSKCEDGVSHNNVTAPVGYNDGLCGSHIKYKDGAYGVGNTQLLGQIGVDLS